MNRVPQSPKAKACLVIRETTWFLFLSLVAILFFFAQPAWPEDKAEQTFTATFIDREGLKTEVTNLLFYWEEKLNQTQLALHELQHVPAMRGTVPIEINFKKIKQIEFTPPDGQGRPTLSITLKNGKTGEFGLSIPGTFKGETEFGAMNAQPTHLRKIVFQ